MQIIFNENYNICRKYLFPQFYAERPYGKLLTDIIEFELLDGKIYLFAMIGCFAEMGLGWTIGAHPTLI